MDTASIVSLPVSVTLVCSQCGAKGEGSCQCGAPYVAAGQRAAQAVAANPEKSNRAIAAEAGVDEKTVRNLRNRTAEKSAVAKRVGKDGKTRRLPTRGRAPLGKQTRRRPVAALPLNQQVNRLLGDLSDPVDDGCDAIVNFLEAHPELEQEGRDAIAIDLQHTANKLLNLAQMIEGRSPWQSATT